MIVTLLGAGTGFSRIDRYGRAILVEAAGQPLLFDCGRGATIRLHQARVLAADVTTVFLTHPNRDHIDGIQDLWLTGWLLGRRAPLHVCGPAGTRERAGRLVRTCAADVGIREAAGPYLPPKGGEIVCRDLEAGVAYAEGGVRVTAIAADDRRGSGPLGYRVEHDNEVAVIVGRVRHSPGFVAAVAAADLLVFAPWHADSGALEPSRGRLIAAAEDAGRVFAEAGPRLAVVYHRHEEGTFEEGVRRFYRGPLITGRDRMDIEVGGRHPAHVVSCDRPRHAGC